MYKSVNILVHFGPVIVAVDKFKCFGSSCVAGNWCCVVIVHNLQPKVRIFKDVKLLSVS